MYNYKQIIRSNSSTSYVRKDNKKFMATSSNAWDTAVDVDNDYKTQEDNFWSDTTEEDNFFSNDDNDDDDMNCEFFS